MIPGISNKSEETVAAATIKPTRPQNTVVVEKLNVEAPKRAIKKTAKSKGSTQVMPNKTNAMQAGTELPEKSDNLMIELQKMDIEFIDNRKQSGILWIIHKPEEKERVVALLERFDCKSYMERRGAIATNNRPAWRVVF